MRKVILAFSIILIHSYSCLGFELIVLGDSRSGSGNENFQRTSEIINDAIEYTEKNYDELIGIIMTGDYVNKRKNVDEWEKWREASEKVFKYPVYPCIGNHDVEPADCPRLFPLCEKKLYYDWNYYQTFKVERWWSIDIENIHLVSLDSNLVGLDLSSLKGDILEVLQYVWFVYDLTKNVDRPTIVIWHEPAYGSHTWFGKGHGSNRFIRERYVPICEKYGVKMVICGHNHWYERVTVNGIKHITTGGAGAPLMSTSLLQRDKVEGSEVNITAYHWCVLSIHDQVMELDVIEHQTHRLLDSFEITDLQRKPESYK